MFAAKFRKFFGMAPYHRKPTLNDLNDATEVTIQARGQRMFYVFEGDDRNGSHIVGGPYKNRGIAQGQLTRRINSGQISAGYVA